MDNAITVNLYGDGSKNAKLRAEYIYCDYAEQCTAYKQGKCLAVASFFQPRCKLGRVSIVSGGLKRSKKFEKVYIDAKSHENYAKLKYPSNMYFAKTDEKMFLSIPYIRIEPFEDGSIKISDPCFGGNGCVFEKEHITVDNFIKILEFQPRSMMGGIIGDYQRKTVPMLLFQLKRYSPELYKKIMKEKPEFEKMNPSWIGKTAKLATCNRDMAYRDHKGNVFYFDGDYIVCENYKTAFMSFDAKCGEMRIKVSEDMNAEITDNNQVLEDTIFE